MPRHYVYAMIAKDPAPAGDGDTSSWFRFYKWCVQGDSFIVTRYPFKSISAGDFLWFSMDDEIFGYVKIEEVEDQTVGGVVRRQELRYNAEKMQQIPPGAYYRPQAGIGRELPTSVSESLMKISFPAEKNRLVLPKNED